MYVYKFVITYCNGHVKSEWVCCEAGESLADLKDRADDRLDEIEQDESVSSVKMTRRTVPGI
jgi:hypothetical protein